MVSSFLRKVFIFFQDFFGESIPNKNVKKEQNILIERLIKERNYLTLSDVLEQGIIFDEIDRKIFKNFIFNLYNEEDVSNKSLRIHDGYIEMFNNVIVTNADKIDEELVILAILFYLIPLYVSHTSEKELVKVYLNHEKYKQELVLTNNNYKRIRKSYNLKQRIKYFMSSGSYLIDNENGLIFVNKYITNNINDFILKAFKVINNMVGGGYLINNFLYLVIELFPSLDEEMKKNVIVNFNLLRENKNIEFEFDNKINLFLKENKDYRQKLDVSHLVDKNKTVNSINKKVEEVKVINTTIKYLLDNNDFSEEVRKLCEKILLNYEELSKNKEKMNIEYVLFIEKLINEKAVIILKHYLEINSLNKLIHNNAFVEISTDEEYKTCINSLNGINTVLISELKKLKEIKKDKLMAVENYINSER